MSHPTIEEFTQERAYTTWKGERGGISYTVAFWGYGRGIASYHGDKGRWNYYLHLREEQFQPDDFEAMTTPRAEHELLNLRGHKSWDYYRSSLYDLDWHGGITFYEITGEEPYRRIKAGCDYSHGFDEGMHYTLDFVEIEAKACVDSLLARVTPLVRCRWSGEYGQPADMVPVTVGGFVLASKRDEIPWPQWFAEVPS